jgi:hypothetical protein
MNMKCQNRVSIPAAGASGKWFNARQHDYMDVRILYSPHRLLLHGVHQSDMFVDQTSSPISHSVSANRRLGAVCRPQTMTR